MRMGLELGTAICLTLALTSIVHAGDRLIPFQARVTDAAGDPLDGQHRVTFAIYDTETGGTPLNGWSEIHESVAIRAGQLNVLLGSVRSLDDPDGNGDPSDRVDFSSALANRFLGIKIGADTNQEMVPRHQLVPSFHAHRSDTAELADDATHAVLAERSNIAGDVDDGVIVEDKLLDGQVSLQKLHPDVQQGLADLEAENIAREQFLVPPGAVMAFDLDSCPVGWAAFAELNGRVVVGTGAGANMTNRTRGATGGSERVTITVSQMPSHTHNMGLYNREAQGTASDRVDHDGRSNGIKTKATGGGQSHENMPPYLALTYCKKN